MYTYKLKCIQVFKLRSQALLVIFLLLLDQPSKVYRAQTVTVFHSDTKSQCIKFFKLSSF